MSNLQIHQFLCGSDNFGVLIHDPQAGVTAAIDAPETGAIRRALTDKGWTLTHILTTHHHGDHTAGHRELKAETGCNIVGAEKDVQRIPGLDITVREGDIYPFGSFEVRILETPGHTLGHVSYWLPGAGVLFTGDTLFSLGCGRLFEGTATDMWASLQKIMQLPPETAVYCGHEYTLSNAAFALTVEPGNAMLQQRAQEVRELRRKGEFTLPTTLALEMATNPFLRPDSPEIQERIGMSGYPLEEVWAQIRRRKDHF